MSHAFPFAFFSSEQTRFINLCRYAICSKAIYWQDLTHHQIYCTTCFLVEQLINHANCQFITSHIVVIYPIQLTPRCSICHTSTARQIAIASCTRCWEFLTGLWALLSEEERREIEDFGEPTLLFVAGHRNNYTDL